MSGALHGPLLAPDKAARLLDDVIYERVLGCIDLHALFLVELDLWVALTECGAADGDEATRMAKEMIDRALARVPDDERRYGVACPDCDSGQLRGS